MQTAVEWLVNELENHHVFHDIKNTVAYQQAKEMEKQQIIDAVNIPREKRYYNALLYNNSGALLYNNSGEQYYNETYGK
jgi:hypothetical protein